MKISEVNMFYLDAKLEEIKNSGDGSRLAPERKTFNLKPLKQTENSAFAEFSVCCTKWIDFEFLGGCEKVDKYLNCHWFLKYWTLLLNFSSNTLIFSSRSLILSS